MKQIILIAIACFAFASVASAQNSATATGTAQATVVLPIALFAGPNQPGNTPGTSLNFGNIIPPATGSGTVMVNNDGTYAFGAGMQPGTQQGTLTAQTWEITGQALYYYNMSNPASITKGANPAWPNGMSLSVNGFSNANPHQLSAGGTDYLSQGGTLTVPAGTTPGNYSATWTEVATYN
jgi:hypothetical protein